MLSDKEKGSIERNTGYLSFVGGLLAPRRPACLLVRWLLGLLVQLLLLLADRLFSPSGVLTSALILLVFAGVLRDRTVACM